VVGSVLYGSVADGPWYVELMRARADVSLIRDQIVFGRAFAEQAGAKPQADAATPVSESGTAAGWWQAA
jgi:nitrite reductase (NADH) large subunit